MAEERISEFMDMSMETSQKANKTEKNCKRMYKICGRTTEDITHRRKRGKERDKRSI